jgi:beta-xylosidase
MRNFYVTTNDIWTGEWSDPIYFDFCGIDPSLFFDDDERAYIQGSWRSGNLLETKCTIRQFEVEIETGKALSETKKIWDGFAGKDDAEGPHIYKKDGYYYLLAAEAATFEHHMVTMARSRNIWGPYETYEKNPILTAYGTSGIIQNTGHGDFFQDGDGKWWIAVLGIRNMDGHYPMGRETFLSPAEWPTGGWPKVELPKLKFERVEMSSTTLQKFPTPYYSGRHEFVHIRSSNPEDYDFSSDNRVIRLIPRTASLSSFTGTTTFVGKRQRLLECTTTVILNPIAEQFPKGSSISAGLTVYKESIRHAEIYYDHRTSSICFSKMNNLLSDDAQTESQTLQTVGRIHFQIKASVEAFEFSFKLEDDGWTKVGSVNTAEFSGYDFTGTIFGIFAFTEHEEAGANVAFEDFQIK